MTQTYAQIQKKIAALQKSADALRGKELAGVVARIRTAIQHYGLTAQQLGFGGSASTAAGSVSTAKVSTNKPAVRNARAAKYSDGNGNTWGGMGKRPYWIRDALAAGKSLADFLPGSKPAVPAAAVVAKGKATKVAKPKQKQQRRPSTVVYRDGNGNSWTGRGPQPRWLKEVLAGGRKLEDLMG